MLIFDDFFSPRACTRAIAITEPAPAKPVIPATAAGFAPPTDKAGLQCDYLRVMPTLMAGSGNKPKLTATAIVDVHVQASSPPATTMTNGPAAAPSVQQHQQIQHLVSSPILKAMPPVLNPGLAFSAPTSSDPAILVFLRQRPKCGFDLPTLHSANPVVAAVDMRPRQQAMHSNVSHAADSMNQSGGQQQRRFGHYTNYMKVGGDTHTHT